MSCSAGPASPQEGLSKLGSLGFWLSNREKDLQEVGREGTFGESEPVAHGARSWIPKDWKQSPHPVLTQPWEVAGPWWGWPAVLGIWRLSSGFAKCSQVFCEHGGPREWCWEWISRGWMVSTSKATLMDWRAKAFAEVPGLCRTLREREREMGWPAMTKTECLTNRSGEAQGHCSFGLDKTMQSKTRNKSCTSCQVIPHSLMISSKNKLLELLPRPKTETQEETQGLDLSCPLPPHLESWVHWGSRAPGSVLLQMRIDLLKVYFSYDFYFLYFLPF